MCKIGRGLAAGVEDRLFSEEKANPDEVMKSQMTLLAMQDTHGGQLQRFRAVMGDSTFSKGPWSDF